MRSPARKSTASRPLVLFAIAMWIPNALWLGFVTQNLWAWFIQPLGAPRIGVWQACGVTTLVQLLVYDRRFLAEKDIRGDDKIITSLFAALLVPAFALAFGFLYHVLGT